ncbi:N-acetyltransferase family protein [Eionea flava]
MMSVTITQATLNDVAEIAVIFNQYRIFYQQSSNVELAEYFIGERLRNNESVIFLAKEGEQLLGFVQLYPSFSSVSARRTWILNDLYVNEVSRGLGIGKLLLGEVKNFSNESGVKGVGLQTAIDNTTAQGLYESLGYKKDTNFYSYFLDLE